MHINSLRSWKVISVSSGNLKEKLIIALLVYPVHMHHTCACRDITNSQWLTPEALISTTEACSHSLFCLRHLTFHTETWDWASERGIRRRMALEINMYLLLQGTLVSFPPTDCYYLRMSFWGSGPFLSINAPFSQPTIRSPLRPLHSASAAVLHLLITQASRLPLRNN